MTMIDIIKAMAREDFAALEAQSLCRIRLAVSSWYVSAGGHIRKATESIQLCGAVYPEDWQAQVEHDAAVAAMLRADGRAWVVIQTMRVTVGSESRVCCAVCDQGNANTE